MALEVPGESIPPGGLLRGRVLEPPAAGKLDGSRTLGVVGLASGSESLRLRAPGSCGARSRRREKLGDTRGRIGLWGLGNDAGGGLGGRGLERPQAGILAARVGSSRDAAREHMQAVG